MVLCNKVLWQAARLRLVTGWPPQGTLAAYPYGSAVI